MGRHCCVPFCKGNYRNGPKVSVYRFPKHDSMKKQWILNIGRDNFVPRNDSAVCAAHFTPECFTSTSGSTTLKPRPCRANKLLKHPKLNTNAIPTIFANSSIEMQQTSAASCVLINEPKPSVEKQTYVSEFNASQSQQLLLHIDTINSADLFTDKVEYDKDVWNVTYQSAIIVFYHLSYNDRKLCIDRSIEFQWAFNAFDVNVLVNDTRVNVKYYDHLLTKNQVLRYSQASNILKFAINYNSVASADCVYSNAAIILEKSMTVEDENYDMLQFIVQQLNLISVPKKQRRYPSATVLFAYKIFSCSHTIYEFIYKSHVLCLPSARTLCSLSSSLSCESGIFSNSKYLDYVFSSWKSFQKSVCLLIDEMVVTPRLQLLKSGKFIGNAVNTQIEELATSVLGFVIAQIKGKISEVVGLVPCANLTGAQLHSYTLQVLNAANKYNIEVKCIITDNHRVNQKLFKMLSSNVNSIEESVARTINPITKSVIYLMNDPVHLIKSVRNNWLKNDIFIFPDLGNPGLTLKASFSDVINLYNRESSALLRIARGLNRKSVHPNDIEKQQVKPVLSIFSDDCQLALTSYAEELRISSGTIKFVDLFSKWWKIMNVKTLSQATRFRDSWRNVINSVDDALLMYLKNFLTFLKEWNKVDKKQRLTDMTIGAFILTVRSIIDLTEDLLTNDHYVILGNFQSDPIESRFGQYRQVCGSRYLLSVADVYEGEKKIRLRHLIANDSACFSTVLKSFKQSNNNNMDNHSCDEIDAEKFIAASVKYEFVELHSSEELVIDHVSGYVQKQIDKKICADCRNRLQTCDSYNTNQYFVSNNRGGLTAPSMPVVREAKSCIQVFKQLMNSTARMDFLRKVNQRMILVNVMSSLLLNQSWFSFNNDTFVCSHGHAHWKTICHNIMANILLFNYSHQKSDEIKTKSITARKIKKLSNK